MIFGYALDAAVVLAAIIALCVGLKRGITHTFLVKRRRITALILGALCAKPLAKFISKQFLLAPFSRFVMKTADLTEIPDANSAEALLDNVPLVIRFVADKLGYDLMDSANRAYESGEGMYFTVIEDLSFPLVNAVALVLCSILFFFFMRLIIKVLASIAERIVELPILKQINAVAGGAFTLVMTFAVMWVLSQVLVFALSFEKLASISFLQGFSPEKTYIFRYLWGFKPLSFILSIQ